MSNYIIEQPNKPDFEVIDEICMFGLLEQLPKPTSDDALNVIYGLRASQFKILKSNEGVILGLIYFTIDDSEKNLIKIDFLYAVQKREGIGTLLLNDIVGFAKKNKFSTILLEVSAIDKRANDFYKAKGFMKVSERIVDSKLNLVIMELKV